MDFHKQLELLILCSIIKYTQESSFDLDIPLPSPRSVEASENRSDPSKVVSVVIDKDKKGSSSYVHFSETPSLIESGTRVKIEYLCRRGEIIGLQLEVDVESQGSRIAYQNRWRCKTDGVNKATVRVKLPNVLAYRPSYFNEHAQVVSSARLLLWIMEKAVSSSKSINKLDYFRIAKVKTSQKVRIRDPFDRPGKATTRCVLWSMEITLGKPFTPQCPKEPEVYQGVDFPIALGGFHNGVHRMLPKYSNRELQQERLNSVNRPTSTISVWLYVVDYCHKHLCSIVQSLRWDEEYCTPLIFINKQGQIHVQGKLVDGTFKAFLTSKDLIIPKLQWCHLVLTIKNRRWQVTIMCDRAWEKVRPEDMTVLIFDKDVRYDDTECLLVFGGSEVTPSFKGYIGEAIVYRRKAFDISQLPRKHPYDRIFDLGLGDWDKKCHKYLVWVDHVMYRAKMVVEEVMRRKTCEDSVYNMFAGRSRKKAFSCEVYSGPIPRQYSLAYSTVRRLTLQGSTVTRGVMADALMSNITSQLEEKGLLGIRGVMPLLRQASCYGNQDATFMLATILNNGMGVKADENQAHKYLMYGALEGNELCLLALGNKHMVGQDGVPQDYDQAYAYYKRVALKTGEDRGIHQKDGVFTEHVRLTDEAELKSQTEENGDVFQWVKHQAQQGVVSAQKEMARMLYWGARGVSRNIDQAINYYKMGAENQDPASVYDYGIVHLKGHGVAENHTKAMELFKKSAKMGHHPAYAVMGWYALEQEKDMVKAAEYLKKAYSRGNRDAAHNLGYMIISGLYPGDKKGFVDALPYYSFAALRGHPDASIMIARYNMRGGPPCDRNSKLATEWLRFIGEQNIAIGKVLRSGLKAYRNHNWPAALLYYHMAAETGLEVGAFNTAFLCDQNDDGLLNYLEKECIWRFFNQSIQRDEKRTNTYSWIKMGDYYWYGCQGPRDVEKAATYYGYAAVRGDPHALFNLGSMIEEGSKLPRSVLRDAKIDSPTNNTNQVLMKIYKRCSESSRQESQVPCALALYRIKALDFWIRHQILLKVSTFTGAFVALLMTVAWLVSYFRSQPRFVSNV